MPDSPKVSAGIRRAIEENMRQQDEIIVSSRDQMHQSMRGHAVSDVESSSLMDQEEDMEEFKAYEVTPTT